MGAAVEIPEDDGFAVVDGAGFDGTVEFGGGEGEGDEVFVGVEALAGGFGGEGGEEVVVDFVAVAGGGEGSAEGDEVDHVVAGFLAGFAAGGFLGRLALLHAAGDAFREGLLHGFAVLTDEDEAAIGELPEDADGAAVAEDPGRVGAPPLPGRGAAPHIQSSNFMDTSQETPETQGMGTVVRRNAPNGEVPRPLRSLVSSWRRDA